jgi:hypothetical protein
VLNFNANDWDVDKIRQRAEMFDVDDFKSRVKHYVEDRYEEFKKGMGQCQMTVV